MICIEIVNIDIDYHWQGSFYVSIVIMYNIIQAYSETSILFIYWHDDDVLLNYETHAIQSLS